MLPNWTGWKTVKVLLASLTTLAASLAVGFPGTVTAHDCGVAVIILGAVTGAVVVASATSAGPTVIAK